MATQTFPISAVPLSYPAVVSTSDNGNFTQFNSSVQNNYQEFAFDVFGTGALVNVYQSGGRVSVDGGAFAPLPDAGSGFGSVPAFDGLSDSWHRVILKNVPYLHDSEAVTVTSPTTPAVRAAAWYGNSYNLLAPATIAAVKAAGAWLETPSFASLRTGGYWGNSLAIKTTAGATGLRIFGYTGGANRTFDVYVNGVFNSVATLNLDWNSADVLAGIAPAAQLIELRARDADRTDIYICCIQIVGGSLDTSYVPDYETQIAWQGDSIGQNSTSEAPGSDTAPIFLIAQKLGLQPLNAAWSGDEVPATDDKINAILRRKPRTLFTYFGSNEQLHGVSAATFKTNYQAYLQKLLSGTADHPGLSNDTTDAICVLMPYPWLVAQNPAFVGATNDAVAGLTLPANAPRVELIPTTGQPAFQGVDELHPHNAQQAAIANYLAPFAALPLTFFSTTTLASGTQTHVHFSAALTTAPAPSDFTFTPARAISAAVLDAGDVLLTHAKIYQNEALALAGNGAGYAAFDAQNVTNNSTQTAPISALTPAQAASIAKIDALADAVAGIQAALALNLDAKVSSRNAAAPPTAAAIAAAVASKPVILQTNALLRAGVAPDGTLTEGGAELGRFPRLDDGGIGEFQNANA